MLKVLDLFSGVGAIVSALKKIGVEFDIVAFSEIDRFAIQNYQLLHGSHLNLGDISLVKEINIPDCDLISYGFPCQDISVAGKQEGIVQGGTRSGLLYEAFRIIQNKKPKYAIAENVKNLVGSTFKNDFDNYLQQLSLLGYNNYWQVLNAKDFGIPQNRERVFLISIRQDIDDGSFTFPQPTKLHKRLKDILEDNPNEKYFMSDDVSKALVYNIENAKAGDQIQVVSNIPKEICNDNERQRRVYSIDGISPSLLARSDSAKIIGLGFLDMKAGVQVRKVYDPEGISPTLDTMQGGHRQPKIYNNLRVRKLTPQESWRLMGFDDSDFNIVRGTTSDTQLYKQAGNSIVVPVLTAILQQLLQ